MEKTLSLNPYNEMFDMKYERNRISMKSNAKKRLACLAMATLVTVSTASCTLVLKEDYDSGMDGIYGENNWETIPNPNYPNYGDSDNYYPNGGIVTPERTEELAYAMLSDGTYMVVGRGNCTDSHIEIPGWYNGAPVTVIGSSAFSGEGYLY